VTLESGDAMKIRILNRWHAVRNGQTLPVDLDASAPPERAAA
jgi:hypothetical protein